MANTVTAKCITEWEAHKSNCSGFVRAVAQQLGVSLSGLANNIVDQIQAAPWITLGAGAGKQAAQKAAEGYLVIGGLKASGHGHVVVVVEGELANGKYPHAYWGRLNGAGKKDQTVNYSWNASERDQVLYAYYGTKKF